MMFRWVVALLAVSMPAAGVSQTQVAVYGEFSASDLAGGSQGDYLYGGTTGVLLDGPIWFHHLALAADVQGRFITHNGESLNGVTFGPRVSLPLQRFGGLSPFAEFLVGFARYNDGANNATTDDTFQANAGVTKRVSRRWDVVADYSYAQYGANFGEYSPKTYSAGALFHFNKY